MNSIPEELLVMILQYIPARKLLNCQLVNRKFYETVSRNRNRLKKHVVQVHLHRSRTHIKEEDMRKNFVAHLLIEKAAITMYTNYVYVFGSVSGKRELKIARILASIAGSDVAIQRNCPDGVYIRRRREFRYLKAPHNRYFVINTENPIECVCELIRLNARTFDITFAELRNHSLPYDIRQKIMRSFTGAHIKLLRFYGPTTKEEVLLYQNIFRTKYVSFFCFQSRGDQNLDFVNELLPYTDSFHFFICESDYSMWWSNVRQLIEDWQMGKVNMVDLKFEWKETTSFQVTIREDFPSAKADNDGIYHLYRPCDSNSLYMKTVSTDQELLNVGSYSVCIKSSAVFK